MQQANSPSALPLPKSRQIRHICHIADIHIRPGTESKESRFSRFDEFLEVFARIASFLEQKFCDSGDLVIVIAGDIVHDNRKAGAPCIELFYEIMRRLSDIAPIYIIRGNHDYNQSSLVPQDILGSLIHGLRAYKNIAYLCETGIYEASNVLFGILAIQDALKAGDTHGRVESLPPFPKPSSYSVALNKKKIALFHGDVPHTYPLDWVSSGYDLVLLGDLHGQQVENMDKREGGIEEIRGTGDVFSSSSYYYSHSSSSQSRVPWSYAGSTLQQNFGEALFGHGFLLWDLERTTVDTHHVKNRFGFVTVMYKSSNDTPSSCDTGDVNCVMIDLSSSHKQCLKHNYVPFKKAVTLPWFPKVIRLRIKKDKGYKYIYTQFILDAFKEAGIDIESSQESFLSVDDLSSAKGVQEDESIGDGSSTDMDLQRYNNPDAWCSFVKESTSLDDDISVEWESWFHRPKSLTIDLPTLCPQYLQIIPANLQNDIFERNQKILGSIDTYKKTIESLGIQSDTLGHTTFSLLYMNWAYVLCFRDKCHFNFQTLDNNVHCIGGKNGFGKTSFLETICIALFGEGFPNRSNKQHSAAIICLQIPPRQRAHTSIVFQVDHEKYRLKRTFERTSVDAEKLQTKDITLERFVTEEEKGKGNGSFSFKEIHSGKKATQDWMATHIGTIQSFLTSCMISQSSEEEFFSKKIVEQKAYLDKQLKLDSSTAFLALLKTASLGYNDIVKRVRDVIDVLKDSEVMQFDKAIYEKGRWAIDDLNGKLKALQHQRALLRQIVDDKGADENIMKLGEQELKKQLEVLRLELESNKRDDHHHSMEELVKEIILFEHQLQGDGMEEEEDMKDKDHLHKKLESHLQEKPTRPSSSPEFLSQQEDHFIRDVSKFDYSKLTSSIRKAESKYSEMGFNLVDMKNETMETEDRLVFERKEETKLKEMMDREMTIINGIKASLPISGHEIDDALIDIWKKKIHMLAHKYDSRDICVEKLNVHLSNPPSCARPLLSLREIEEKEARVSSWKRKRSNLEIRGSLDENQRAIHSLQEKIAASTHDSLTQHHRQAEIYKDIACKQNEIEVLLTGESDGNGGNRIPGPTLPSQTPRPPQPKHSNEQERERELEVYHKKDADCKSMKKLLGITQEQSLDILLEMNHEEQTETRIAINCIEELQIQWTKEKDSEHHLRGLLLACGSSHTYNPSCIACMSHPWKKKQDAIEHNLSTVMQKKEELERQREGMKQKTIKIFGNDEDKDIDKDFNNVDMQVELTSHLTHLVRREKELNEYDNLKKETIALRSFWRSEAIVLDNYNKWEYSLAQKKNDLNDAKKILHILNEQIDSLNRDLESLRDKLRILLEVQTEWRFLENQWDEVNGLAQVSKELEVNNSAAFTKWQAWDGICQELRDDLDDWELLTDSLSKVQREIERKIELRIKEEKYKELIDNHEKILGGIGKDETRLRDLTRSIDEGTMVCKTIESIDLPMLKKNLAEYEEINKKLEETQTYLAHARAYENWENHLATLQSLIKKAEMYEELQEKKEMLGMMEKRQRIQKQYEDCKIAIRSLDDWEKWIKTNAEMEIVRESLYKAEANQSNLDDLHERYNKRSQDLESLHSSHTFLASHQKTLISVMEKFSTFKDWVFEHKIIPIILTHVNELLEIMCLNHRPIALDCLFDKIRKDEVQKTFSWVLRDGHHKPPLEKASGFQKCVINLAMRIVLGRLGVSGIKNIQLFIDEGFTSCDRDNLQNIPFVLKKMLLMYTSVLLVSHLDELKNHVPSCINIERDISLGLSSLCYGEKNTHYNYEKRRE